MKAEERAAPVADELCRMSTEDDVPNETVRSMIATAIREAEEAALEKAEREAGIIREVAGGVPDGDGWKAYVKSRKDACARIRALTSKEGE